LFKNTVDVETKYLDFPQRCERRERDIGMCYWVLDAMLVVWLIVASLPWRSCIDVQMLIC